MIVRINQFDPANVEPYSGWNDRGLSGPIFYDWPDDTNAFEVLILESDEKQRQLAAAFRQSQLRRILPEVIESLIDPNEQIIARLDGPLTAGELAGVVGHLTDPSGTGRFATSPAQKMDAHAAPPIMSVRIHLTPARLKALCSDPAIGLQSAVRLRIFLATDALVNPLLNLNELDDDRWGDILPRCGMVIGSMRTLQSIYLLTRRLDAVRVKDQIMRRLLSTADARAV
jgi:hypothetical protein